MAVNGWYMDRGHGFHILIGRTTCFVIDIIVPIRISFIELYFGMIHFDIIVIIILVPMYHHFISILGTSDTQNRFIPLILHQ